MLLELDDSTVGDDELLEELVVTAGELEEELDKEELTKELDNAALELMELLFTGALEFELLLLEPLPPDDPPHAANVNASEQMANRVTQDFIDKPSQD